tara:strand:+ start:335 stop:526 length:192 start_codon:yes stop_codon:yes gene_type:complete
MTIEKKLEHLEKEIKDSKEKIEKVQLTLDDLSVKLNKHIDFIDETYEGLKNPLDAAKRWLGRR